ncbi:hypothetical protein ACOZ38_43725 [Sphaerisporangium viridialbum]|uniref:hypothetical protein n=1 Tax=Sphaerisporangium viridialbum TaxID=46189 RepID=UPI003C71C246
MFDLITFVIPGLVVCLLSLGPGARAERGDQQAVDVALADQVFDPQVRPSSQRT